MRMGSFCVAQIRDVQSGNYRYFIICTTTDWQDYWQKILEKFRNDPKWVLCNLREMPTGWEPGVFTSSKCQKKQFRASVSLVRRLYLTHINSTDFEEVWSSRDGFSSRHTTWSDAVHNLVNSQTI